MGLNIEGLTKKQVALLDTMWGIEETEELEAFISSLPMRDRALASSLLILITHELIEEVLGKVKVFKEAQEVINRVK